MKFQITAFLTLCAVSLVNSIAIPYQDMTDVQIANYVAQSADYKDNQGDIVYPLAGDTWYVGDKVNVTFKTDSSSNDNQTVSLFFFNKSGTLAGGPLVGPETSFDFVVPADAKSEPNATSLLLAVRRQDRYLQTVDSVVLHVLEK